MNKIWFEWDADKDTENQEKLGIPFSLAQYAFADPKRIIAEDLAHSKIEKRFFCFGEADGGILTVRFTYRGGEFEFLELATGVKERLFMKTKIKYTNEAIEAKVMMDFLPPPEELAFREEGVKVTIALSKKSIDFFKSEASKHHTQYQRMIRKLIDSYVDNYAEPLARRARGTGQKRPAP
jgi:uncharacterized DUF497 family protein